MSKIDNRNNNNFSYGKKFYFGKAWDAYLRPGRSGNNLTFETARRTYEAAGYSGQDIEEFVVSGRWPSLGDQNFAE